MPREVLRPIDYLANHIIIAREIPIPQLAFHWVRMRYGGSRDYPYDIIQIPPMSVKQ